MVGNESIFLAISRIVKRFPDAGHDMPHREPMVDVEERGE
jgi:hypothetical protein